MKIPTDEEIKRYTNVLYTNKRLNELIHVLRLYQLVKRTLLGTVQYLLKGRASGKAKFHEKKLPALLSIK